MQCVEAAGKILFVGINFLARSPKVSKPELDQVSYMYILPYHMSQLVMSQSPASTFNAALPRVYILESPVSTCNTALCLDAIQSKVYLQPRYLTIYTSNNSRKTLHIPEQFALVYEFASGPYCTQVQL